MGKCSLRRTRSYSTGTLSPNKYRMRNDIVKIEGKDPGPVSVVLAGVHGDEIPGIQALEAILLGLSIDRGTVYYGYGSPLAIERNVRYVKSDLNRMFREDGSLSCEERRSYEYRRSRVLMKYLDRSDALLDIHASRTPESRPFIICEPVSDPISRYLPVDVVVSGFDRVQPGGTDHYMNRRGAMGICLECGSNEDAVAVALAERGIRNFLIAKGHISGRADVERQTHFEATLCYRAKSERFVPEHVFRDFEEVRQGQRIGRDGVRDINAPYDGRVLFVRDCRRGEEAFVFCQKK